MDDYTALEYEDVYGKTPPRTKILRKNRDKNQREKLGTMSSPKVIKAKTPLGRRNTISTFYDELLAKQDNADSSENSQKRTNKRSMKLLRGSERDLKLDISSAQAVSDSSKENGYHQPQTPSYQIGGCKRFMSLSSRTFQCINKVDSTEKTAKKPSLESALECGDCPQNRVDFYRTLTLLVRLGINRPQNCERQTRRALSKEETIWQNEWKDLIWLELQAFHADRTLNEQDSYICSVRENVEPLLKDIMNYRFERHSNRYSENNDSGMEDDCPGCFSMYCNPCLEAQSEALHDIEELMTRLENAEALFPSSKAFAETYPLYNSPEFVGRVKAISLWYNMTKHQRLKLSILGRLLALLDSKQCQWPLLCDEKTSESGSPSDSNNSSSSSAVDGLIDGKINDFSTVAPIIMLLNSQHEKNVSPYRRYIENILKTRALHKSLSFLDKLHHVLQRAQLTLEKPQDDEIFKQSVCDSDDDELRRYGSWSPEAKVLNLPSYRSYFIFLAKVPLEVIHEYLLMRLEQKPENPSPLCVRQLMRELKEGLRIACTERHKVVSYIESAVAGTDETVEQFKEKLKEFDECMVRVFKDYLEYVERWTLLHHDTFQKNLLEEEFSFSCSVIDVIPQASVMLGAKFAQIMCTILKRIGERLITRVDEIVGGISEDDPNLIKPKFFSAFRELQTLFNDEREMSLKAMAFAKAIWNRSGYVFDHPKEFLSAVVGFKCIIPEAIAKVQIVFDLISSISLDETDKVALNARLREILMLGYQLGFEFYKDLSMNIPTTKKSKLTRGMVHFANLWMKFVTEKCERGRGKRPRWAYQGLEFLVTVCEPSNTQHLTDEEFEDLKNNMDACISHVIGTTAPNTPDSGIHSASPRSSVEHIKIRSRGSSPSPRPTYRSQRSNASRKTSMEQSSPGVDQVDTSFTRRDDRNGRTCFVKIQLPPSSHAERWREAVDTLETEIDDSLRKQRLIGKVIGGTENKTHNRRRNVTFSWQRGIKIGQGRFGKVYTAVNNKTGEMMAVKEIALQHNDIMTIKRVSEEMKILEGIVHKNLVRYYGVEVHKDEMLIFMEFCEEGTLENLVAATVGGLPELLLRRYTFQLVSGVLVIHDHGIVHRDIKTANIFLTEDGNCLKIGDFGCAAKIKSNTTMPGELRGFVGTQAYMAPEVFTQNMSEGHGRAADIWSVGCCVVEMASGKRPWYQYDSNYQIMFKVGMGQSPDPPDDMIDEGLDFLDVCFKHNPRERATAHELINHSFVKVVEDLI